LKTELVDEFRSCTKWYATRIVRYPIASGVIEGACRHLIKDSMERAGMHWSLEGAHAMLDVRSVCLGGQWELFQEQRIEQEKNCLYPHRAFVAGEAFFALAP